MSWAFPGPGNERVLMRSDPMRSGVLWKPCLGEGEAKTEGGVCTHWPAVQRIALAAARARLYCWMCRHLHATISALITFATSESHFKFPRGRMRS